MVKLLNKNSLLYAKAVLAMILLSFSYNAQEPNVIDELISRLARYNNEFHTEKAYLATDRYLYRPGEIIWFQGFVSSNPDGRETSYSQDLYVKLISSNGEEMSFRRYPLVDDMVSGNLRIPKTFIPGKYYIVAYTGWMKNQDIDEVFRKRNTRKQAF